jgi:hypothetical protein
MKKPGTLPGRSNTRGGYQGLGKTAPTDPRLGKKRKKAMEKFQLGKGYNTGGGADQTTREKLKFHLDKQISKLKKGIDKKRPTKSEYEDLRARSRQDRKRTKHNIGGRANLLEEMGRIDARKHPDAADRAEKRRVIGELNRGYKSGGRARYNSGGAVLKGKKVGCQIK